MQHPADLADLIENFSAFADIEQPEVEAVIGNWYASFT
jgi:hypothetical protein